MALLIVNLDKQIGNARLGATRSEQVPDVELRIWPDTGELAESNTSPSSARISMSCRHCRT